MENWLCMFEHVQHRQKNALVRNVASWDYGILESKGNKR